MGDAENRTIVPLLNSYKCGLARRRFLQTVTGGLKLQKAPCSIHMLQVLLYLAPVIVAAPFIAVDAVAVWNEYYLSLVYSCTTTLLVFSLRATETCVRWRKRATVQIATSDSVRVQLNDEERVEITSCCSYETVRFLVHPKGVVSLFLHSLLITGLLSFASSFLLLPRVLSKHLPIPAAVIVGALGWLVSCSAFYSLNVNPPHETATYRPTDRLELRPLMRPTYIICIATTFISIRLAVHSPDLYLQLLYVGLCLLPLGWLCGVLPPLDTLLPWVLEQTLTRLLGGSSMATDLRLLVMFLLSLVSAVLVAVIGHHSRPTAVLLATVFGYVLSLDLSLFVRILWNIAHRKVFSKFSTFNCFDCKPVIRWKVYALVSTLQGVVLLIISLPLVYFTFTAGDSAKVVASKAAGGCVLALSVFLWASGSSQRVYLLGLLRNPLHPWNSEDVQKYKTWRKNLGYFSVPGRLVLGYVSPLLMLTYVGLAGDSNVPGVPHVWLGAFGVARILRKVWQNTWRAQLELSVAAVLLLSLPQDSIWIRLGVGTQALIIGVGLEVCGGIFLKLRLIFTYYLSFIVKDRHKTRCWLFTAVIVIGPLLFPLVLAVVVFSSAISAPLLPLFTLPVFFLSFPRTQRFWPSLLDYGSSYTKCKDSVYYQQAVPELARALARMCSAGTGSIQPGTYYLLRYQDRLLIAVVLEMGRGYFSLNLRGLELQETSCHTIEAAEIDDIFSSAYNPKSCSSPGFWLNTHPLSTLQPVDSAVVQTYSDARSVLTGIIDQPYSLERFASNLLKCVVWVLYHYCASARKKEGLERKGGDSKEEDGEEEGNKRGSREKEGDGKKTATHKEGPESLQVFTGWAQRVHTLPGSPGELWRSSDHAITTAATDSRHGTALKPKESDSLSWNSVESIGDNSGTDDQLSPQHMIINTMPGLIPVDIPLEPSLTEHTSSRDWIHNRAIPTTSQHTPKPLPQKRDLFWVPSPWLEFPLPESELNVLLNKFPEHWLDFLCAANTGTPRPCAEEELTFKRLCMTCLNIMDASHHTPGAAQTRPFHVHSGFHGEFLYSTERDWLLGNRDLFQLMLKAYRYAVKLLCDEAVLGEAEDCAELSDYLQSYDRDYFIGSEDDPEWEKAVLAQKPHLFSIGKDSDNDTYTAHVLTLQDQLVHIGRLDSEAVHAVWSDLMLELFYLTNDDEERYSIQAHTILLRNLTIQAADPPLGYPVYSSGITRAPMYSSFLKCGPQYA